jgi:hypothetical protein
MNVWRKFLAFRIKDHPLPAGLASRLWDLVTEWNTLGVKIDEDIFLAFILQGSLTPKAAVTEDFKCHIKLAMQQDPQRLTR